LAGRKVKQFFLANKVMATLGPQKLFLETLLQNPITGDKRKNEHSSTVNQDHNIQPTGSSKGPEILAT
jgi:hypothetical protein